MSCSCSSPERRPDAKILGIHCKSLRFHHSCPMILSLLGALAPTHWTKNMKAQMRAEEVSHNAFIIPKHVMGLVC